MTRLPDPPKELLTLRDRRDSCHDRAAALTRSTNHRSDLFGATISGLCAIHCTLTPLFFAARPLLETSVHDVPHVGQWWATLDYLFLVLSLAAVGYSAHRTDSKAIRVALWAAWTVFACGLLLEPVAISVAKAMMYAGSATLIIAHLLNHRHCAAG